MNHKYLSKREVGGDLMAGRREEKHVTEAESEREATT